MILPILLCYSVDIPGVRRPGFFESLFLQRPVTPAFHHIAMGPDHFADLLLGKNLTPLIGLAATEKALRLVRALLETVIFFLTAELVEGAVLDCPLQPVRCRLQTEKPGNTAKCWPRMFKHV